MDSLFKNLPRETRPVECLGITFESDAARQNYFLDKLREKLNDPAFRQLPGFPIGEDENILRLSDPPYYTACPNPFLENFIQHYGQVYDPATDTYHREPFAVDVSEGKTDPIYSAHAYHTKVPYRAIMRAILYYTNPGDLILDGFAGSGMTGVAAQMCGQPPSDFRQQIELEWQAAKMSPLQWGARRAVLNDLSPAATFIAANYNLPFDLYTFEQEANRILVNLKKELGWMYETRHTDGKTKGQINYTVWSEVFACPECGGEIVFYQEAFDQKTNQVRDTFFCPHCGTELTKLRLERVYETYLDSQLNTLTKRLKRQAILINYTVGKHRFEKQPDKDDLATLQRIEQMSLPPLVPTNEIPFMHMTHQRAKMETFGITHLHHFYLPRIAYTLGKIYEKINSVTELRLRSMLFFLYDSQLVNLSVQNRYRPEVSFPYNPLNGVYYVSSLVSEANPFIAYGNKVARLVRIFAGYEPKLTDSIISTGDCGQLKFIPDKSIDYIFTDPPFGENIYYADLNFLVESWYRIWTDAQPEAIVDKAKSKKLLDYQRLMQSAFEEYYRVLKPGRWLTVVFHNSRNSVWNAIQEAMTVAGFIVADVRTLDKQQKSYRQVTSTAVKQDLVISAYKPNGGLEERFKLEAGTEAGAWNFVRTHLRQLPVFTSKDGRAEVIAERLNFLLFDRMVAFHVQRGVTIPLSTAEFYAGLEQRFPKRDEMYFLPDQVAEYDQKRIQAKGIEQLQLFVTDESSAIQWLRLALSRRPQTFQEIHPHFMREIGGWQKYEKPLELSELLEYNFLRFDGQGSVPPQIWIWYQNDPDWSDSLKGHSPDNPPAALQQSAKNRWYVPDPTRAADLEKLRERELLKEFEEYRQSKQKQLKVFRLEAVRAGFKKSWQDQQYRTIIEVAEKIPDNVLQEDPKLLMWYDQAVTRMES